MAINRGAFKKLLNKNSIEKENYSKKGNNHFTRLFNYLIEPVEVKQSRFLWLGGIYLIILGIIYSFTN